MRATRIVPSHEHRPQLADWDAGRPSRAAGAHERGAGLERAEHPPRHAIGATGAAPQTVDARRAPPRPRRRAAIELDRRQHRLEPRRHRRRRDAVALQQRRQVEVPRRTACAAGGRSRNPCRLRPRTHHRTAPVRELQRAPRTTPPIVRPSPSPPAISAARAARLRGPRAPRDHPRGIGNRLRQRALRAASADPPVRRTTRARRARRSRPSSRSTAPTSTCSSSPRRVHVAAPQRSAFWRAVGSYFVTAPPARSSPSACR